MFKSKTFWSVYGTQVILQHKNGMQCLSTKTVVSIDCLDSIENSTRLSMRHMIMALKNKDGDPLFM